MDLDADFLFLVANSFFTIFCGVTLLFFIYTKRLERHVFYYGWSIGFILYGSQLLLRAFSSTLFLTSVPMIVAFIIFPLSTFLLNPKKSHWQLFFSLTSLYVVLAILFLLGVLEECKQTWILGSAFLYLPVAILLLFHRNHFGASVDKLLIGWFSLFLTNTLFPFGGHVADILAIFSKMVIFMGILNYDFAIIMNKIRKELVSPILLSDTGFVEEGGLRLITFQKNHYTSLVTVSDWLIQNVDSNIARNVETTIIVLNDVIPYSVLRSIVWKKPGMAKVFLFSSNPTNKEEFTTLRLDISELGLTITEVTKKNSLSGEKGELILIDLSIMIHTFSVQQAYALLLNKMGMLRSSGTELTAVFHPETHDKMVVSLFESIADTIIENPFK